MSLEQLIDSYLVAFDWNVERKLIQSLKTYSHSSYDRAYGYRGYRWWVEPDGRLCSERSN